MKFASIGDCCIDKYSDKRILGGMAYNSAIAASKLGAKVSVISAIGKDKNGQNYKKSFLKAKINFDFVQISDKPTSSVDIALDKTKSPIFGEWRLGALKDWILNKQDLEFINKHDVAKITFLKPLKKNFINFCKTKMPNTLKAGDFDGDTSYSYSPREVEKYFDGLDVIVKSFDKHEKEEINLLKQLSKRERKIILVTLGENGSICFFKDKMFLQKAVKINTSNTTGFGDIYVAVFLIKYFKTGDIQFSMSEATKAVGVLSK